jgi:aminoglycoside 3-N-acetyltransferase
VDRAGTRVGCARELDDIAVTGHALCRAVCSGEGSEVCVEGAVLLDDEHDVLDLPSRLGQALFLADGRGGTLVDAVLDVVGPGGTLLSYQDWELCVDVWDEDGHVRDEYRDHVPPFDPATARPARDHGIIAATIGTRRGVRKSGNPGACVAALGARAEAFTADHPLDFGYGADSPFARLVESAGRVLMVGAPLDTMTLLHHAEHLADLPGKRRVRIEYPLAAPTGTEWRIVEEYDTGDPVVDGAPHDYFADIVQDFLAAGNGRQGKVGEANAVLVDAAAITAFGVAWLEERFGHGRR